MTYLMTAFIFSQGALSCFASASASLVITRRHVEKRRGPFPGPLFEFLEDV